MEEKISFELNGKVVDITLDKNQTLLGALRNHFNLTGTKYGCGLGYCGSCTVLMDDVPVRSCSIYMEDVAGRKITTIEGLSDGKKLHPLQQAFADHDALQCGYCTSGMIMNAAGLLRKNPHPSREEILNAMEDNLCRCGAYPRIVEAIEEAAQKM